ncbi:hypothetical protein [Parvicella tangerina]|uniref:Uncharacterized protein n=1 Tax=Parvicella tangerina TaxID=2829795 RepID=A0A916JR52_9FLAO|nr:hypothetical protein [Parvicella tangerina]CAG5086874.1 hypothetical protein CRYO30217_03315 [Parvicella tangerina]
MRSLVFLIALFGVSVFNAQKISNRSSIVNYLNQKIERGEPLVAHVLVPLCDNEHQGIVPTSPSIGNGMDPDHNLYWMTSKGVKRFFRDLPDWEMLNAYENVRDDILERVVFKKEFDNGAIVILIADAYRGDRMHECLNDYFNSLSGQLEDSLQVGNWNVQINGNADLVAFNGHNGLMDEKTTFTKASSTTKLKDAVSISCASNGYFKQYYDKTNSYPLVHTTNLLYPGAFILEGILNEWAMLKSDAQCKKAAGSAYYKHKPKSGPNGSQNLFDYGW